MNLAWWIIIIAAIAFAALVFTWWFFSWLARKEDEEEEKQSFEDTPLTDNPGHPCCVDCKCKENGNPEKANP